MLADAVEGLVPHHAADSFRRHSERALETHLRFTPPEMFRALREGASAEAGELDICAADRAKLLDLLLMSHRSLRGHSRERSLGEEDVLVRGHLVLEQPVRQNDVAPDEVIAPGDTLLDVLAAMDDELEGQRAHGGARATATGRRQGHEAQTSVELDERLFQTLREARTVLVGQPEDGIRSSCATLRFPGAHSQSVPRSSARISREC